MEGYHPDWVGAITAGISAVIALTLAKAIFPRAGGARFYVTAGVLIAVIALALRELLRRFGI